MSRGIASICKRLLHLDSTGEPYPSVKGKARNGARAKMWAIIEDLGEDADYQITYTENGGIRISFVIDPDGKLSSDAT